MRMKVIDRIFLILTILVLLALSLLLLAVAWHYVGEAFLHDWVYNLYTVWPNPLILTAIALALVIMALRLLYAGTIPYRRVTRALVRKMEAGTVSITLDTIASIARRHALAIEGMRDVRCTIVPREDGIRVLYRISLDDDVVIPEKTQAIQTHVKEQVEALTGVTIKESCVLVDNRRPEEKKKSGVGDAQ
ncbi:MAG: alkaline shock response membrane anchor protein AmaP [Christensenellales bacterium]|jgi:hypothetical protein